MLRDSHDLAGIRLVVSDVDGTLLDKNKRLTPRTRAAVAALRDRGVQLVLASSRPPRGLEVLHRELELTSAVVAFNGGLVLNADGQPLAEHALANTVNEQILAMLRRCGAHVWAFAGREWFVEDPQGPRVAREAEVIGFAPTVVADVGQRESATKLVAVSYEDAVLVECEHTVARELGNHVSVARGHACYVDVTHPSATKGNAVRLLAQHFGFPRSAILSIGDMATDVTMFPESGIGVAMGNAPESVKASAHHVTTSNDQEGFARAVEQLVLG